MIFPERENIDKWFFDFYEGNLSSDQQNMLFAFLEDHPDLLEDFELWNETKLEHQDISQFTFDKKEQLERKENSRIPKIVFITISLLICSTMFLDFKDTNTNKEEQTISQSNQQKTQLAKNGRKTPGTKTNFESQNTSKQNTNGLDQKTTLDRSQEIPREDIQHNLFASNSPNESLLQNKNIGYSNNQNLNDRTPISKVKKVSTNKNNLLNSSFNLNNINTYHSGFIVDINNNNTPSSTVEKTTFTNNDVSLNREEIKLEPLKVHTIENLYLKKSNLSKIVSSKAKANHSSSAHFKLKTPKWMKDIGQRDLGLAYIPDQVYALPEISQADVMISNAGAVSQFRMQTSSIARWIENPSNQLLSNQLNMDWYGRSSRMGVSFQMNYDRFGNGVFSNYDAAIAISPKIALNRKVSFEPALRVRIGNYQVDQSKLNDYNNTNIQYNTGLNQMVSFNPTLEPGSNLLYHDMDAGFTINTNKFYVGFQGTNLTQHFNDIFSNTENDYSRAPSKLTAITGTQFMSKNQKMTFSPFVYVEHSNGKTKKFVGFSSFIHGLHVGSSYSDDHSFSSLLGFGNKRFRLDFSSSMQRNDLGSISFIHQVGMRINSLTSHKERRYITL